MKRKLRQVPVGNTPTAFRYISTIEGDPGQSSHALLTELVVDGVFMGLLSCGPLPFQTFKMEQNGDAWVVTMEALSS